MVNPLHYTLIILSLVGWTISQSDVPTPHCKFRPVYSTLPLTLNEILSGDLSSFATGYNLDFTIKTGSEIAIVTQKLVLNDKLNHPFSRIVNHHVQHSGNKWGSQMHFLVEDDAATYLFTGTIKSQTSVPVLDDPIIVEFSKDTRCFDAAVFLDHGVAVVDCVVSNSSELGFGSLQNKFIYIDLTKRQVSKSVNNEMYVSFTNMTKRRVTRFHDPGTGHWYMLRSYLAGGVDANNVGNTYMELFQATDPTDLQIVRLVDRSYLGLKYLSITDFKVYLGDIFLLDYLNGLFRLDITSGQHITVTGHYQEVGFTRFSVYSDDLDQQVLVALANSHAVYEIDWTTIAHPTLKTKYSLMEHSHIQDIVVDREYLIVQSSSNATSDLGNLTLNYTWIFTKNARTYMNAYKVIDHTSGDVFVDLDRDTHALLVTDDTGITNYQINNPTLMILQSDSSKMGTSQTVLIEANSTDPHIPAQIICTSRTTVYLVQRDNMTLWRTGITVPEEYYANYPGILEVFLHDYMVGPNITYSVAPVQPTHQLPLNYINKQNRSQIHFDNPPEVGEINFFHTDVVPHYGNDTVIFYYQDIRNVTHSASCIHLGDDINMYCVITREYSHRSRIHSFASAIFFDSRGFSEYYYAFTLEDSKNVVTVVDYISHVRLATIELAQGFEGQVENLAVTNGILFLTVPAMKTIYAYKLSQCSNSVCPLAFSINAQTLRPLGVSYFSPQQVITTRYHPQVLFIKGKGSVLILDVDNHQNLKLIEELFSAAIQNPRFRLVVNLNSLIVVTPPDIIEHYDLRQMYSKKVAQVKSYTLYYYTLPQDFDLEFSDVGQLFYVNALDTKTNLTVVLVYRTASYAVAALYDVINLPGTYSHRNLEIEVSGYEVDYVSIIASGHFSIIREFQRPHVVIVDTFSDFKFRLTFNNSISRENLTDVIVRIANYPEDFSPTDEFKKKRDNLKLQNQSFFTVDTRKWFTGHILRYNWTCADCHNGKIRVHNHVSYMSQLRLNGNDYTETFLGGLVLSHDLFRLGINGSVQQVILMPSQRASQNCLRTVSRFDDSLFVTACEVFGYGVNLYLTSRASSKAFTWGPYRSTAIYMRNIELQHNIFAVIDVDINPGRKTRSGGVYLYAIEMDQYSENELDELDYIDSNDFQAAHGWDFEDAYIGNAHLVYDNADDTYRLYVTEVSHGLFILDFKHHPGNHEIQIITSNFIDLNALLKDNNLHMPKDAIFLAVTLVGAKYNPHFQVENIVVTTHGFHNFELTLIYDDNGRILSTILHRVYYRYAFYESDNFVKSAGGYLAVGYTLPAVFEEWTPWTSQLIVVYDTRDYEGDSAMGYSERYMLGAHTLNHSDHAVFGFNTTYNPENNGTRIGLVVIDRRYATLSQLSVSRNLTIDVTDSSIKDQKITLTPYNDFSQLTFEIEVVNGKPIPPEPDDDSDYTLQIIILAVGSVIMVACLGYLLMLLFKKPLTELEKSLVEDPEPVVASYINESLAMTENSRQQALVDTVRETKSNSSSKGDSVVDAPVAVQDIRRDEVQSQQQ